ncbi:MAG: aminoglycoside phosphotransferase family protein [Anaerolineales bacterium]|nr:aminoglycoside phosphotransferase family protein [Anaerolineales bacterium]
MFPFKQFNIEQAMSLGQGMEARVFALDKSRVLKIYHRPPHLSHLKTLKHFYEQLNAQDFPLVLPLIHEIGVENEQVYVIEKRLYGKNMEQVTREVNPVVIEQMLGKYIQALYAFSRITYKTPITQYKLFDEKGISQVKDGDWHSFLKRYIAQRVGETPCFQHHVSKLGEKLERLEQILSMPYTGPLSPIHGDFFPGNLLIDESLKVTSLLDFGLFTMFGDHLFDVATGCVFFDMYDQLGLNIRQRLLSLAAEVYGASVIPILHRYILIFSFISANIYAPDCSDGHYAWCVANLNHPIYWDTLQ